MILPWVLSLVSLSLSFNLEPKHPIIFPTSGNTSFGYSLAFAKFKSSINSYIQLLVGAPDGHCTYCKEIYKSGALYRCDLKNISCIDVTSSVIGTHISNNSLNWTHARFGATVAVSHNGLVVACAPNLRLKQDIYDYSMPGSCYQSQIHENITTARGLFTIDNTTRDRGFSAHFVQHTECMSNCNDFLMVGSPGFYYGHGQVTVTDSNDNNEIRKLEEFAQYDSYFGYALAAGRFNKEYKSQITYLVSSPQGGMGFVKAFYPNTTLKGNQFGEYFGYSLLVFDSDSNGVDDMLIVGAPLYCKSEGQGASTYEQGRIYTFKYKENEFHQSDDEEIMGNSSSNARFGMSLAVVGDLNHDKYNDIVVGAPYEDGKGAIYIYHGSKNGLERNYKQRITPSDIKGGLGLRGFGYSLAGGVDIDGNLVNDIAIGSYLSNHVVVIKTYPVVHIRAHLSDNGIILNRTSTTNFTISFSLEYLSNVDIKKNVVLKVKFDLDEYFGRLTKLGFTCNMTNDLVVLKGPGIPFECGVNLKLRNEKLFHDEPIKIEVHYEVLKHSWEQENKSSLDGGKKVDKEVFWHAITDPEKQKLSETLKLQLNQECKSNVCVVDLTVNAEIRHSREQFIMGSTNNFTLIVRISNKGDPAYSTVLNVNFPPGIMQLRIPPTCRFSQETAILTCEFEGPLYSTNSTKYEEKVELDLDMSQLSIEQRNLTFKFNVTSPNEANNTLNDNTFTLTKTVDLLSIFKIEGLKKGTQISMIREDLESNATNKDYLKLVHSYEVFNKGPSSVANASARFHIPKYVHTNGGKKAELLNSLNLKATNNLREYLCEFQEDERLSLTKPDTYLKNNMDPEGTQRITAVSCLSSLYTCVVYTCNFGKIKRDNTRIKIEITFYVNINILGELMLKQDESYERSKAIIETLGSIINHSVSQYLNSTDSVFEDSTYTVLKGDSDNISYRDIILAGVVGALLLAVVVKVLSKAGFFKRATKEKLDNLKQKNASPALEQDGETFQEENVSEEI